MKKITNIGGNMSSLVSQDQNQSIVSRRDEFEKKKELLKKTVCKGSSDEQFQLFLHACERTGLDPFMRQIYAVMRNDKNNGSQMTIQTGIDGYRLIAERTSKYSPGKEATYVYDDKGRVFSATAYVKKQTADGTWHEVSSTAFMSEYVQKDRFGNPTRFWQNMPHTMLAKCAEALALRKSFPAELSGIYTAEEMSQADVVEEIQAEFIEEQKPKEQPKFKLCLDECVELAEKVVDGIMKQKPDYKGIGLENLHFYLYNYQQKHPYEDIRVRFSKPCVNPDVFIEKVKEWASSRDGEYEIETILHVDFHEREKEAQ